MFGICVCSLLYCNANRCRWHCYRRRRVKCVRRDQRANGKQGCNGGNSTFSNYCFPDSIKGSFMLLKFTEVDVRAMAEVDDLNFVGLRSV